MEQPSLSQSEVGERKVVKGPRYPLRLVVGSLGVGGNFLQASEAGEIVFT